MKIPKFSIKFKRKKTKKFEFKYEDNLKASAYSSQKKLLENFSISQFGLSSNEAFARQEKYGKNFVDTNPFKWFTQLLKAYLSPFNIILAAISAFNFYQYFSGQAEIPDLAAAMIVFLMLLISGTFTYIQSIRANFMAKKLVKFISKKAVVIRDTNLNAKEISTKNEFDLIKFGTEIDATDLVPGDIVYLTHGDVVPADIRILSSNNFLLNQSSLTGESSPIHKGNSASNNKELFDMENICLMGTNVLSGSAIGIVIGTGYNSYLASISQTVNETRPQTAFEKGIRSVTFVLICFMVVLTPIIYLVDAWMKDGFTGEAAIMYAAAAAVGLTPEMMPMIVTTNLARGATKMSQNKIVTKNLNSIQNLGAIDILCTDKTGTITNDNIELVDCKTLDSKSEDNLLKLLYINSYFQTGLKNPLDNAIINYVKNNNINVTTKLYQKIHEIPFDFNRRKLTIVVKNAYDNTTVITKGAAEEIIDSCKFVNYQGKVVPIDESLMRQIKSSVSNLNAQGLRVVAIAYKDIKPNPDDEEFLNNVEKDLIFYGFASFLDTPKASAAGMIKSLSYYGVSLKILTGDNEQVTRAVCERIHLDVQGVITGKDIENMSEEELKKVVEKNNIFVKLTPLQKADVIKALRSNGHIVGYMGDGINDGPVLRQSDVAISVNNATDMVKEASDLILLEKSLAVIEDGIIQGRTVFANILKYIKITLASQFGNVFTILVSLFWLKFEPMIPIQMLFQNLIYDFSQFAIAFDKVDQNFIMRPQRWSTKDFLPFAFINGPISSIFDMITFAVLLYVYKIPNTGSITDGQLATFNAGWFIEGIVTQTWVVQMFRTEKIPFIQSRAPFIVNFMTLLVTLLAFLIPYVPEIAVNFQMSPPNATYIAIVLAIIGSYCLLSQYTKVLYIKVFKKWL